MKVYSFIGKGKVYIAERTNDVPGALFEIGDVSKLSVAISEESKTQIDNSTGAGGLRKKITFIKDVEAQMTLNDLSPENLARAIRGAASDVSAGTVTAEVRTAYKDALVPFAYIPNTGSSITVTNSAGDVTYVKDTDYTVTGAGIFIITAGAITNAQSIKVTYTKLAADVIEGLLNSGSEYKLVFDGLNTADSDSQFVVTLHKVSFSPTSGLDFIGDDFGKIEVKASVLKDTTITSGSESKYIKIQMKA